jgi:electron transfer flavoprotein alpha/beta subunit
MMRNEDPAIRMRRYRWVFLYQIEISTACLGALETALALRQRDLVPAAVMELQMAQDRANAALEECELDIDFIDTYARGALRALRDATDRSLASVAELLAEATLPREPHSDN